MAFLLSSLTPWSLKNFADGSVEIDEDQVERELSTIETNCTNIISKYIPEDSSSINELRSLIHDEDSDTYWTFRKDLFNFEASKMMFRGLYFVDPTTVGNPQVRYCLYRLNLATLACQVSLAMPDQKEWIQELGRAMPVCFVPTNTFADPFPHKSWIEKYHAEVLTQLFIYEIESNEDLSAAQMKDRINDLISILDPEFSIIGRLSYLLQAIQSFEIDNDRERFLDHLEKSHSWNNFLVALTNYLRLARNYLKFTLEHTDQNANFANRTPRSLKRPFVPSLDIVNSRSGSGKNLAKRLKPADPKYQDSPLRFKQREKRAEGDIEPPKDELAKPPGSLNDEHAASFKPQQELRSPKKGKQTRRDQSSPKPSEKNLSDEEEDLPIRFMRSSRRGKLGPSNTNRRTGSADLEEIQNMPKSKETSSTTRSLRPRNTEKTPNRDTGARKKTVLASTSPVSDSKPRRRSSRVAGLVREDKAPVALSENVPILNHIVRRTRSSSKWAAVENNLPGSTPIVDNQMPAPKQRGRESGASIDADESGEDKELEQTERKSNGNIEADESEEDEEHEQTSIGNKDNIEGDDKRSREHEIYEQIQISSDEDIEADDNRSQSIVGSEQTEIRNERNLAEHLDARHQSNSEPIQLDDHETENDHEPEIQESSEEDELEIEIPQSTLKTVQAAKAHALTNHLWEISSTIQSRNIQPVEAPSMRTNSNPVSRVPSLPRTIVQAQLKTQQYPLGPGIVQKLTDVATETHNPKSPNSGISISNAHRQPASDSPELSRQTKRAHLPFDIVPIFSDMLRQIQSKSVIGAATVKNSSHQADMDKENINAVIVNKEGIDSGGTDPDARLWSKIKSIQLGVQLPGRLSSQAVKSAPKPSSSITTIQNTASVLSVQNIDGNLHEPTPTSALAFSASVSGPHLDSSKGVVPPIENTDKKQREPSPIITSSPISKSLSSIGATSASMSRQSIGNPTGFGLPVQKIDSNQHGPAPILKYAPVDYRIPSTPTSPTLVSSQSGGNLAAFVPGVQNIDRYHRGPAPILKSTSISYRIPSTPVSSASGSGRSNGSSTAAVPPIQNIDRNRRDPEPLFKFTQSNRIPSAFTSYASVSGQNLGNPFYKEYLKEQNTSIFVESSEEETDSYIGPSPPLPDSIQFGNQLPGRLSSQTAKPVPTPSASDTTNLNTASVISVHNIEGTLHRPTTVLTSAPDSNRIASALASSASVSDPKNGTRYIGGHVKDQDTSSLFVESSEEDNSYIDPLPPPPDSDDDSDDENVEKNSKAAWNQSVQGRSERAQAPTNPSKPLTPTA